jgi:hypothetical protein
MAKPTELLPRLLTFRSVNPLYGAFLLNHLGIASADERLQALESVLGLPGPLLKFVRVPYDLGEGPLAERINPQLIERGLMAAPPKPGDDEEEDDDRWSDEPPDRPLMLADKLRLLFDSQYPGIEDVQTQAVWGAGELLRFGGKFNNYVKARDLTKQEGIVFRHLLRLILLCEEFAVHTPAETTPEEWQAYLRGLADQLTAACREVDPTSTDELLEMAHAADVVEGEAGIGGEGVSCTT